MKDGELAERVRRASEDEIRVWKRVSGRMRGGGLALNVR
jgi:hypothetical protein